MTRRGRCRETVGPVTVATIEASHSAAPRFDEATPNVTECTVSSMYAPKTASLHGLYITPEASDREPPRLAASAGVDPQAQSGRMPDGFSRWGGPPGLEATERSHSVEPDGNFFSSGVYGAMAPRAVHMEPLPFLDDVAASAAAATIDQHHRARSPSIEPGGYGRRGYVDVLDRYHRARSPSIGAGYNQLDFPGFDSGTPEPPMDDDDDAEPYKEGWSSRSPATTSSTTPSPSTPATNRRWSGDRPRLRSDVQCALPWRTSFNPQAALPSTSYY